MYGDGGGKEEVGGQRTMLARLIYVGDVDGVIDSGSGVGSGGSQNGHGGMGRNSARKYSCVVQLMNLLLS